MAEAEEILTDAARHATVFAQRLWRRYSPAPDAPASLSLSEVAERLELLLSAVFVVSALRVLMPRLSRRFARWLQGSRTRS